MYLRPVLLALACAAALPALARPPVLPVGSVQGSGPTSALLGQRVVVQGQLGADMRDGLGGFFLLGSEDGDAATSDGIFVQTQADDSLPPGPWLQVTGTVAELPAGKDGESLTALVAERITAFKPARGQALRAPVPLSAVPADWERYEAMPVTLRGPLTLAGLHGLQRHGEIIAAFGGRLWQPTEVALPGSPAYTALVAENAQRSVLLDDASSRREPDLAGLLGNALAPRSGMQVDTVEAVVDQRFTAGYRLQLREPLTLPAGTRPAAPPQVPGNLKVAAFNLENYFNGDGHGGGFPTPRGAADATALAAQQAKLVTSINALGADVAALMELEDDGYGAHSSIAQLVAALNADPSGPADWRFVDAGAGPGSNPIRVAIIYRHSRLTPVGKPVMLEDGPFAEHSRVPLAQAFRQGSGDAFSVTAIHLKSKGCRDAQGADADRGDGQGCWNATRVDSARRISDWLASDPTGSGTGHAVVLGDFNAYAREEPMRAMEAAGWRDAFAVAGVQQPYSYVYNGLSGRLDHAMLSPSLAAHLRGAAEWHINADESHRPGYASGNEAGPWRSSDHDPLLLGFQL